MKGKPVFYVLYVLLTLGSYLHMLDFLDMVVLGDDGGVWYDQP